MEIVTSRDGTPIAFDRTGGGPPVVIVVGAFNDRSRGEPLARELAPRFTVYTYDRRARGDSGDTPPYAADREVEDLAALIAEVGAPVSVLGYSSGAVIALRAAATGLPITRLALFEPPAVTGDGSARSPSDLAARMSDLIGAGRPGDAVSLFQAEGVGLPAEVIAQIRQAPFWPALEAMAQSAVYDASLTAEPVPAQVLAAVTVPTLVLSGDATWPRLVDAAAGAAGALPDAEHRVVPGTDHDMVPEAVGPVLAEFFAAAERAR
ncbi:alpha/beta fold hydrolase [Georgenia sp. SYP-B2076]|uniref:alpha/beta fold hydrolase n=1 Tax=Georgenia sp. SYP-B2076 TaxID=2495881 RepID=UPI000F8E3051|nr:alpha/beta fold hydrolase [Georgenia sp. SYP-B2076]